MLNTSEKIIKLKTSLLNLAEELGNVSKACQVMGVSRDTFYRYKAAVEEGGVEALFERTRRKLNLASGVLDRQRRFGGVLGEFSKILSCCGEEKFVIGPRGAAQP